MKRTSQENPLIPRTSRETPSLWDPSGRLEILADDLQKLFSCLGFLVGWKSWQTPGGIENCIGWLWILAGAVWNYFSVLGELAGVPRMFREFSRSSDVYVKMMFWITVVHNIGVLSFTTTSALYFATEDAVAAGFSDRLINSPDTLGDRKISGGFGFLEWNALSFAIVMVTCFLKQMSRLYQLYHEKTPLALSISTQRKLAGLSKSHPEYELFTKQSAALTTLICTGGTIDPLAIYLVKASERYFHRRLYDFFRDLFFSLGAIFSAKSMLDNSTPKNDIAVSFFCYLIATVMSIAELLYEKIYLRCTQAQAKPESYYYGPLLGRFACFKNMWKEEHATPSPRYTELSA